MEMCVNAAKWSLNKIMFADDEQNCDIIFIATTTTIDSHLTKSLNNHEAK